MLFVLALLFSIIVVVLYARNPLTGIFLYIGIVLFCPYVNIGALSFRIELYLVPLLFLITFMKKGGRMNIPPLFLIWVLYVGYLLLVSFLNNAPKLESEVNIIALYNYLRFGCLILIGANLTASKALLDRFNKTLFYLSIPVAFLAIGILLGNETASSITQSFFTSPTRPVFTAQINNIEAGFLFRSIGVFENVSYYASFILVILTIGVTNIFSAYSSYKLWEKFLVWFTIALNLVAGVTTSSLTFYAGLGILVFFMWIKRPVATLKIFIFLTFCFYIIVAAFFKNFLSTNQQYIDSFAYLIQSLIGGDKVTERYALVSRENGDLSTLINDSWLQGNGFRVFDKIVVNDSLYLEFFYQGGLVGSLVLVLFICSILFYMVRSTWIRSKQIYLIFIILLITGIGCNSLTVVRMSEWFWLMLGIISSSLNTKIEVHYETNLLVKSNYSFT